MKSQPRDARGRFISSNGSGQLELLLNELSENMVSSRWQMLKALIDPRRDIDDECGYPKLSEITDEVYRNLYDKEPVAARVVEVLPVETWRTQPTVFEAEDVDEVTPFEEAWDELPQTLRGEQSWYHGEEGNPVWSILRSLDILSGVGCYGVLLLGLDDGAELKEPATFVRNAKPTATPGHKLLYARAFDASLVDILEYESDKGSPRFGHPTKYNICLRDPNRPEEGLGGANTTVEVHWTRVIHVADNCGSDQIFGVSRMQRVFPRLWDLRKLYGGSAEMYWRGAFPGLALETSPQIAGQRIKMATGTVRAQLEKYMTGLQRYLALSGMSVKSLSPQVVDPSPQIKTQIESICILLGIPVRIFMGSERGELASSQDDSTWNDRLTYRQAMHVTPKIVVPFIDRLILLGVLPPPKEYTLTWPDLNALTDQEEADIAVKRTEALAKYVGGNVEALMVPLDYMIRVLGMKDDEAEAILEAAEKAAAKREEEEQKRMQEQAELQQQQPPPEEGEEDQDQAPAPGQQPPAPNQQPEQGPAAPFPPGPKKKQPVKKKKGVKKKKTEEAA